MLQVMEGLALIGMPQNHKSCACQLPSIPVLCHDFLDFQ